MPYTLTEQEKEQIRQQYRHNIETINRYIEQGAERNGIDAAPFKYKLDMAGLNKRLNDPEQVYVYKRSLEILARENKLKEIQETLQAKYRGQRDPNKVYALDRHMHTELIPSDDPEAMAYNEAIYKRYIEHPEAVAQAKLQRLFNSNAKDLDLIAQNKNPDGLMVAWADKNYELAFTSFEAFGTIKDFPQNSLTPAMQKYMHSVTRNYESMMDAGDKMHNINDAFFIAPHTLTDQQENLLGATNFEIDHPNVAEALRKGVKNPAQHADMKKQGFIKFYGTLDKKNINLEKDGALTEYVVETNETRLDKKYASLGKWIKGDATGDPQLKKLSPEEVKDFKKIFKIDYTKEKGFEDIPFPEKFKEPAWKAARDELIFKHAMNNKLPISEVDIGGLGKVASYIKGGFFERTFRTTSHEYNNFIQTMEAYDKPNHVNYHNSKPVKMAANDYLLKKGVKTREDAMRLGYPEKDRALLCLDTIETFQKHEPLAEDKLIPGTTEVIKGPKKEWPPAIDNPNEVNDLPVIPNEIEHNAPKVEKVKEVDNNIEKESEAPEINQ